MGKVTLSARVAWTDDAYLATIDNLSLTGTGSSIKETQDDLVEKFMSWVQACEGQGTLETMLLEAGYAGVEEDTELELQFVESQTINQ